MWIVPQFFEVMRLQMYILSDASGVNQKSYQIKKSDEPVKATLTCMPMMA